MSQNSRREVRPLFSIFETAIGLLATQVALILAVSRAGENPLRARIGKDDTEYATKLVGFLISTVIDTVQGSLSENADEKAKKRILKVIASAGPKGVTRNELTRKTQFIRRSMRDEYLEDLIDAGEIVRRENIGHVGQVYFLGGVNE